MSGVTMKRARQMHRLQNRNRETKEVTVGEGETAKTVRRMRWAGPKKDYQPFKKWARENVSLFTSRPPSPKLLGILA